MRAIIARRDGLHCARSLRRYPVLGRARPAVPHSLGRRESLPPQGTGVVPGAEGQDTTGRQRHPYHSRRTLSHDRLAAHLYRRATGHAPHTLAPPRVSSVLALEISPPRAPADSREPTAVDRRDGDGESNVG